MSYKIITAKELLDWNIEKVPTLVDPILPKTGLVGIVGSSDTGKSSFLRQLALSVSTGKQDFLGFKMNTTHQRSIYMSTEDDEFAISSLLNKSKERYSEPERLLKTGFMFEFENLLGDLNDVLTRKPCDLVVLDAFADIFPGDMNRVNEVRRFLNGFGSLAKKHGCLFAILHHTVKRSQNQPPSKDNALGSQGFEAKMRTLIELRRDPRNSDIRHMCIVKGNYLPESYKDRSFVLNFESDMTFSPPTGRVSFEMLGPSSQSANSDKRQSRAFELQREGLTIKEISDTMKKEGFEKVSKSTIGEVLKGGDSISIQPVP